MDSRNGIVAVLLFIDRVRSRDWSGVFFVEVFIIAGLVIANRRIRLGRSYILLSREHDT